MEVNNGDLKERLRHHREAQTWHTGGARQFVLINPDGPEAADRLSALEAEVERLRERVAFTLSDASRRLRKEDVIAVCASPDLCFEYGGQVRCEPCAVKASAALGVVIDDTHSHLPEVCRLRRKVEAAEARATAAYAQGAEAMREVIRKGMELASSRGVVPPEAAKVLHEVAEAVANCKLPVPPRSTEKEMEPVRMRPISELTLADYGGNVEAFVCDLRSHAAEVGVILSDGAAAEAQQKEKP